MRYAANATLLNNTMLPVLAAQGVGEVPTFPESITLMTNYSCNYRCRMCFQDHYDRGDISWQVVEKVAQALPFVDTLQINGGEPFLYSRFGELVAMAGDSATKVRLITNGALMDDRIRRLLVENQVFNVKLSLDAGTAKTYKHIRGGNFLKVVGNLAELAKLKAATGSSLPIVEFNIVAMRSNITELPKILVLAQNLGVYQVNLYYMFCTRPDWVHESLWFHKDLCDENLAKAAEMAKIIGMNVTLPKPFGAEPDRAARVFKSCEEPWRGCLVNPQGEITPCCGGAPLLGSLADKEFHEVWNGPGLVHLRRTVNTPDKPAYCKACYGRMQDERAMSTHFRSDVLEGLLAGRIPVPVAV